MKPIRVEITKEMLNLASQRDCGQMNLRSFMKGSGNIVGFLGEYMVQKIRPDMKLIDNSDYDFDLNGKKIDVKTKTQTVDQVPVSNWEASIDVNSLHQKADYYIFCRIFKDENDNYPHGWILGGISKKDYLKYSRKLKKGEFDGNNNYKVKQDCLNLEYSYLKEIKLKTK